MVVVGAQENRPEGFDVGELRAGGPSPPDPCPRWIRDSRRRLRLRRRLLARTAVAPASAAEVLLSLLLVMNRMIVRSGISDRRLGERHVVSVARRRHEGRRRGFGACVGGGDSGKRDTAVTVLGVARRRVVRGVRHPRWRRVVFAVIAVCGRRRVAGGKIFCCSPVET